MTPKVIPSSVWAKRHRSESANDISDDSTKVIFQATISQIYYEDRLGKKHFGNVAHRPSKVY